jgi:pimeloyl-ACP methyl ester carboxylesterase
LGLNLRLYFFVLLFVAGSAFAGPTPCRVNGIRGQVQCGQIERPLNPDDKNGRKIAIHYVVLPAAARNKAPDPVFFFAGGPGQSAIKVASTVETLTTRLSGRRDIVLIDQRGTGKSAPLDCDEDDQKTSLQASSSIEQIATRLAQCKKQLETLPYGDLRFFSTTIAMQDAEAIRLDLGYEKINLVGASYGTRAVLEYMRQFPQSTRRAVIDGVAPPDMRLPLSGAPDAQAALDQLIDDCTAQAQCNKTYPKLLDQWRLLLQSLPKQTTITHPVTGRTESLQVDRDMLMNFLRGPLYVPGLSALLPFAISEGAQGRFTALIGLASALSSGPRQLSWGMHLSVICSEDFSLIEKMSASDKESFSKARDFGSQFSSIYQKICPTWPRAIVAPEFYQVPLAKSPVLVLSGGIDPVTPTRHGEQVTKSLGSMARHVVGPKLGHGLMAQGCGRDLLFKFINQSDVGLAVKENSDCLTAIPRPTVMIPKSVYAGAGPSNLESVKP